MNSKNIAIALLAILCGGLLFAYFRTNRSDTAVSAEESVLDQVKSTQKVRLGYITYPPYVQKDLNTGELSGYSIDIAKELAQQMGVKTDFVEATWDTYIADLKSGKFDVLVAPAFNTTKKAMEIDYPTPYAYFSSVAGIAKKTDTRFKTVDDLNKKGIRIAVPQGWVAAEYSNKYLKEATIKVFKGESAALSIADVLTGQSDVALVDGPSVQQYIEQNPNQPVRALFLDKPVVISAGGFAIKKGDFEWSEFLNQAVENMRNDGTLKKLAQKYKLYSYDVSREYSAQ